MIRVLLVDDDPLVCAHLRTILGQADDIEVVGEVHDGAAAEEVARRLGPDLVLMDLRMPGVDGITATERISQSEIETHVVALTTFDVDDVVLRALEAGATGFVLKSTPPQELVELVRAAGRGHSVLSSEAMTQLLLTRRQDAAPPTEIRDALALLTRREAEVLRGLGAGRTNAQIGATLFLAEATVKGHVSAVLDKLRCINRTQAGLIAHQYLTDPDEHLESFLRR